MLKRKSIRTPGTSPRPEAALRIAGAPVAPGGGRLTVKEYVALVKAGDLEDQERTREALQDLERFRL